MKERRPGTVGVEDALSLRALQPTDAVAVSEWHSVPTLTSAARSRSNTLFSRPHSATD